MSNSDSDYVDVLENTNVDAKGSDSEVTEKTEKRGRGKDIGLSLQDILTKHLMNSLVILKTSRSFSL